MDKQKWSLVGSAGLGAGLGAGLMYLLDPEGGRRRRALARDKSVSTLKKGSKAAAKTSRHLGNKTKGLISQAGGAATRVLTGATGSALALAGLKRKDKLGAALGVAGLGLLAHGVTNPDVKQLANRLGRRSKSEPADGQGSLQSGDLSGIQETAHSEPLHQHSQSERSLEPAF